MRRSSLAWAVTAVAIASVAGCTVGDEEATSSGRAKASDALPGVSESGASPAAQPSVADVPELDGTERLAGQKGETRGSASFGYRRGARGDELIVAVRCEGDGIMRVRLTSAGVSFPLVCRPGETGTTYHRLGVHGVENAGAVHVTAPTTVTWSMTIGRGRPVAAER